MIVPNLVCEACGAAYHGATTKPQKLCKKCRSRSRLKGRLSEARRCLTCGIEFIAHSYNAQCCSKKCSSARKKYGPFICRHCGQEFWTINQDRTTYCSLDCSAINRCKPTGETFAEKDKARRLSIRANLTCIDCGDTFCGANANVQRCSHCQTYHALQLTRRASKRRWDYKRKRRFDQFKNKEIYERDGYRCQLCSMRINPLLRWPHPRSATIDHIIPLSKAGTHTRDNVQCACLQCNRRKGARAINAQLLLVG